MVRDISRTNQVRSSTSYDITSLVPCLAVKGTNLMISRGLGEWMDLAIKWQNGLSAYNFTVAIHHHKTHCGCPVQAVQKKAICPQYSAEDRCFTSVVHRKSRMFVEFYNYGDTLENPILANAS